MINYKIHLTRLLMFFMFSLFSNNVQAETHIIEVITDAENGVVRFSPKTVTITKGDTVTWFNKVEDQHNVITYPDGFPKNSQGFSSPYLNKPGDNWSHIFEIEGTYQYHCIPHILMGMRGVVIVGTPTKPDGFHKPTRPEIEIYRKSFLEFYDDDDVEVMPDKLKRILE